MYDFIFLSFQPGLIVIDVPASSPFIQFSIFFWLVMLLINIVLGVIKRLPFL